MAVGSGAVPPAVPTSVVGGRSGGPPPGAAAATAYAVLSPAWRILAVEGLAALTPMRLHLETGAARTTFYRHWPDPAGGQPPPVSRSSRMAALFMQ